MARQSATRLQVGARRFLIRRMTHALVRRDVAMHDDPMRAQSISLVAGCVLAAIAVAAAAAFALLRPQGIPESSPIVMGRDSGALYIRIGDTLHPVPNLSSARLIARSASNPAPASEAAIARAKRGPQMGIPGAPASVGEPLASQTWMACDGERTAVMVGDSDPIGFDASRTVLVRPRGESAATTYLLYEGQRAKVDLRDAAVVRALRLDGVAPQPVSRTLLDVVPEVPEIAAPRIDGAGGVAPPTLRSTTVGAVVRVMRANSVEYYVVLRDGVQSVDEVAADLIRFTHDKNAGPIPAVAPAAIAATPMATELKVATFPQRARAPVGSGDGLTVCAAWSRGRSTSSSNTVVLTGDSIDFEGRNLVTLAQADGAGPNVDAVLLPAGRSAYVRSARIVGDDGTTGAQFLVDDSGVVFGVQDDEAAKALGLGQSPDAAPWPVLANLPRGPLLSTEAASVIRDGMAPP